MKNLFRISILVCFLVSPAAAQVFRWEAPVWPVDSAGYHRILLQPEVTGVTRPGFPDLRLYDSSGIEIPFLVTKDKVRAGIDRFVEYPIVDKNNEPKNSYVVVKNPLSVSDRIDHLVLEINNSAVGRRMTLTGSYDQQTWFAIDDEFVITGYPSYENGAEKVTNVVRFDFPMTDYVYYKFTFDNWSEWWKDYNAPLFVVRAGQLVQTNPASITDNWMEIPGVTVTQRENPQLKRSEIDIVFADTQLVDFLRFRFIAANPTGEYHRGVRLMNVTTIKNQAGLDVVSYDHMASAIFSSNSLNELPVYSLHTDHLVLYILNEDDQPLTIRERLAIQVKNYLVANLDPGNRYYLRFGNDTVARPSYDLSWFESTVPTELEVIGTGSRTAIPILISEKSTGVNSIFEDTTLIWGSIFLVVVILAFMSMKMLREMKNRRETIDERRE